MLFWHYKWGQNINYSQKTAWAVLWTLNKKLRNMSVIWGIFSAKKLWRCVHNEWNMAEEKIPELCLTFPWHDPKKVLVQFNHIVRGFYQFWRENFWHKCINIWRFKLESNRLKKNCKGLCDFKPKHSMLSEFWMNLERIQWFRAQALYAEWISNEIKKAINKV